MVRAPSAARPALTKRTVITPADRQYRLKTETTLPSLARGAATQRLALLSYHVTIGRVHDKKEPVMRVSAVRPSGLV
jgi:hypothetical protein